MERRATVNEDLLTLAREDLQFSARSMGRGPLVILLHGFPDTLATFDAQLPALAAAGYHAVAVSLRGYEPSSQPADGDYHAVRLAEDVVAWLDDLGVTRAHLVGHDWGASAAYAAAVLAPERFASLTAIAVPHPARFAEAYAVDPLQQARSAYVLDFIHAGFEDIVVANDCSYLVALWRRWSPGWTGSTALLNTMQAAFARPGVARAALNYYRQALDTESAAGVASQALFTAPVAVPTLGLCGENDGCISADVFAGAMREEDFPAGLRVQRLPRTGHFLHAETPDKVNALLVKWFDANP